MLTWQTDPNGNQRNLPRKHTNGQAGRVRLFVQTAIPQASEEELRTYYARPVKFGETVLNMQSKVNAAGQSLRQMQTTARNGGS